MARKPVVCKTYFAECERNGTEGGFVCAHAGLLVRASPALQCVGAEIAGRVYGGIGCVTKADIGVGNIAVYWYSVGDETVWTRAADHGTDVVVAAV
jgi:hypothetical protein